MLRFHSTTNSKDTNCNESPEGDRETGAATGNLNFPASYCDQSQTRPAEAALDSRQITNRIAKPRRFARLKVLSQGSGHPVSASNNRVNRGSPLLELRDEAIASLQIRLD